MCIVLLIYVEHSGVVMYKCMVLNVKICACILVNFVKMLFVNGVNTFRNMLKDFQKECECFQKNP